MTTKSDVLARIDQFLAGGGTPTPIDDQELAQFRALVTDLAELRYGLNQDGESLLVLDAWDIARFDVIKAVPVPKAATVTGALQMATAMGDSLAALFGQLNRLSKAQQEPSGARTAVVAVVANDETTSRKLISLEDAGRALFASFEAKNRYQPIRKALDKEQWATEVLATTKQTSGVDAQLRYVNEGAELVSIGIRLPAYNETMTVDLSLSEAAR